MAFAIASRSVADEVGAFEDVDPGPAGPDEVCVDICLSTERDKHAPVFSVILVGDDFLVSSVGSPPRLSFRFGNGLTNAPWTEGRSLEGLAASV